MTTATETKRQDLLQIYSDFHKSAYGFRPRYKYSGYTLAELEADFVRFDRVYDENQKQEELADKRAIAKFEIRVQSVIDMGANDRKTALRWIVESYDTTDFYDTDYFVSYVLGLGYNDFATKLGLELQPFISTRVAHLN